MKKTLTIAIAALMLFACGREATFTIVGTVANAELEGQTVSLYKVIDGTPTFVESTEIIDCAYTFTGTIETPIIAVLFFGEGELLATLVLERGTIRISTDNENNSTVSGTRNNELLREHWDVTEAIQEKMAEIVQAFRKAQQAGNSELMESLAEQHRAYSEESHEFTLNFLKDNINNFAGQHLLPTMVRRLSLEELEEIFARANNRTLESPEIAGALERLEIMRRVAIGQPFVDLTMPDVNGNYISISDFVGNGYLMIDFTATWCGPCRVGKPDMIATFNRFNARGFNIIGVWFDNSREAWINGMNALNMPDWPQMSNLRGWQCDGARLYAVSGIPHSVLIDPNGIIIAKDLRGEDLNVKLTELLGE